MMEQREAYPGEEGVWRKQGLEESVTGRAGLDLQRATCIHCLFMHIVHVQVCIIIVLSYKLQGACSPWL